MGIHEEIQKHVEAYIRRRIKNYRSNSVLSSGKLTDRDIFYCILIIESYKYLGAIDVKHKNCNGDIIITYTFYGDIKRYSIKIKGEWFNGN